jgi:hypothetical protein
MTWNEFKTEVDRSLKEKRISPSIEICWIRFETFPDLELPSDYIPPLEIYCDKLYGICIRN